MADPRAQFTRQDSGYLGHYLRELRKQPGQARANFVTLIQVLSGPGRYLLCALEPKALLDAALAALPIIERTAFRYGLAEKLTPEEAARLEAEPGATKEQICLATLAEFQEELRQAAQDELAKLKGAA